MTISRHSLGALLAFCWLVWATLAGGVAAADNPANPLITDRGTFRPLILVAPSASHNAYQRMRAQLEQHRDAFDQRRMVLYTIAGAEGQRMGRAMTEFETRALLEAMDVAPHGALTVILIGLDGGKKMQLEGYVDPRQVFDIIDNMPLRQRRPAPDTHHEGTS